MLVNLKQLSYGTLVARTEPSFRKLYGQGTPQHNAVLNEIMRRLRPGRP